MKQTEATGPKTAEGKFASSHNAMRHGLASSKLFVLPNEDPQVFAQFHALLFDDHQPATQLEIDLVAEMAGARWRLRRLWSIETGIFHLAINSQLAELAKSCPTLDESLRQTLGFEKMAEAKSLSLLVRYEARIRRSFERALADLLRLQKLRRKAEPQTQGTEHETHQDASQQDASHQENQQNAQQNAPQQAETEKLPNELPPTPELPQNPANPPTNLYQFEPNPNPQPQNHPPPCL